MAVLGDEISYLQDLIFSVIRSDFFLITTNFLIESAIIGVAFMPSINSQIDKIWALDFCRREKNWWVILTFGIEHLFEFKLSSVDKYVCGLLLLLLFQQQLQQQKKLHTISML